MDTAYARSFVPRRLFNILRTLLLLILVLPLFQRTAFAKRARFEQAEFVIALWGDPPVDDAVSDRYLAIQEAGFNIVLGGVGADSPTKAQLQRDAATAANLKVIFSTYGLPVKKLCNCSATYGFLTKDHPVVGDFKKIRKRVGEIRLERPGKLPLINLYAPSTAPSALGAASYAAYLSTYIEVIHPEVLCYDYFAHFEPEQETRDRFVENLSIMHQAAVNYNRPFWNFIKAMPYDSMVAPSDAQLRWQVWTSLAYGSHGLIYFAYWPPPDDAHAMGDGILNSQGEPTARYEFVKHLNVALRNFGAILMNMTCAMVRTGTQIQEEGAAHSIIRVSDADSMAITAGEYTGDKGTRATLLVNNTLDAQETWTLAFDAGTQEIDSVSGRPLPIRDMDDARPGIQVDVDPGDARLYIKPGQ